MGRFVNPDNSAFQVALNSEIYVDKTGLIEYTSRVMNTNQAMICNSRPRRFGKSITANMLTAYYSKGCDSEEMFEGLAISRSASFKTHLNQYDVIHFDVQWCINPADGAEHVVSYIQQNVIDELRQVYPNEIPQTAASLPGAMSSIHAATGRKFIVIIDEWDVLIRDEAANQGIQEKYINFLRGIFKGTEPTKYISLVYLTGILPIKKYGTQSALNNFKEFTMINPGVLSEYVGFTEQEVRGLCGQFHMDFEEAKHWYDGYYFNRVGSVYSPRSVVEAMLSEEFGNYWTGTETYEALKMYIDMDFDGLREAILSMLGGEKCPVNTGTFQNDLTSLRSSDDVMVLLIHLGYLAYDGEAEKVYIPNEEIRQEFFLALKNSGHWEIAKLVKESDELLRAALNLNGEKVADAIEKMHSASTAPIFYDNEQALRSVIRLAFISCMEQFREIQELPSGNGSADMVYLPKKGSVMPIMLVELKWNKGAEGAIAQIKERNYPEVFEGYGSEVLLVGISYDERTKKHECVIEKWRK